MALHHTPVLDHAGDAAAFSLHLKDEAGLQSKPGPEAGCGRHWVDLGLGAKTFMH